MEELARDLTFFGLPSIFLSDPLTVQAVIFGIPYSGGETGRGGTRDGPNAVRLASDQHGEYQREFSRSLYSKDIAIGDGGNLCFEHERKWMFAAVRRAVSACLRGKTLPFFIGGDHSVSLPIVSALADKHGPLCMLHFDAHRDFRSGATCASVIREAVLSRKVRSSGLIQVGIREDPDPEELKEAASRGIKILSCDEAVQGGLKEAIADVVRKSRTPPSWYVSVDMDAADPAFAPGVSYPQPGGFTSRELLSLFSPSVFQGISVVGGDIVEIAPPYDHSNITAHLAAIVLQKMLLLALAG